MCGRYIMRLHLGRGLEPAHKTMVLAELVHLDGVVGEHIPALVTLVGQQHRCDALSIGQHQLGIQVLFPLGNCLERGGPRHVEHNECTHGLAVVHARHVAKPLLA